MWFAHFDCIQTALWLCPTSVSYSCNGELKLHVLAALFLAKICLWHPDRCSVLLLELKHHCDWKPFSQRDLPLVQQSPKRQNNPPSSVITWLPYSSATGHTLKLAKWPWWGKHQLSIIDYQDFLHIHLRAPLSSLINISQKVVRE